MSTSAAERLLARSAARCSTRTTSTTSPSGSSSGSGAAAAAGLAAITIGTETSPARSSARRRRRASSACGRRSASSRRTGILPISATQDTAGPMTRTVADAAAELQAIAGHDPEDPATARRADRPGLPRGLTTDALAGKRIGVINNTNAQYRRRDRRRAGARRDDGADRDADVRPRRSTSSPPSSSATSTPTSAACPRARR